MINNQGSKQTVDAVNRNRFIIKKVNFHKIIVKKGAEFKKEVKSIKELKALI